MLQYVNAFYYPLPPKTDGWENFCGLILYLAKFISYFAQNVMLSDKFSWL